ncbi:hypothetical protein F0U60_46965 [Archangium minus]|uniref:Lipoprotein n=1 Tax=Archangium minus TaxID=83450 RepID=A0ABY9X620_9BACT|nr:hypothetical protein F0U60_46965 [Archangium minus]
MSKRGVKLGVVGVLATGALLTGCTRDGYSEGRTGSLSAQEDYYADQAQEETGKAHSNLDSSASLFETNEQKREANDPERGTGGAGDASPASQLANPQRIQAQGDQWLRQDFRVPYPPPEYSALMAMPLGTGKPLRAGPNGAWVQGTYAVELGSGTASSIAPSSGSLQPQEPAVGTQAPAQRPPVEEGASSTPGQKGENLSQ